MQKHTSGGRTFLRGVAVCSVVLLGSPASPAAQTPGAQAEERTEKAPANANGATPTRLRFDRWGECSSVKRMTDLAQEYDDGRRWSDLQEDLKQLLRNCAFRNKDGKPAPIPAAEAFLFTFILEDQPYYVVVPEEQPYSLTLLGVKSVVPVVLIDKDANLVDAQGVPVSVAADFNLMSTRVPNPLQAQVPAFLKQMAGAAIGAVKVGGREEPAVTMFAYAMGEVELPFKRASMAASGTVTLKCHTEQEKKTLAAQGMPSALATCKGTHTAVDVAIKAAYNNTPKTRLEFTALAAGVIGPYHGHQRMKLDNGRYASDPAPHAMTMAAMAIHPVAYNGSLPGPSQAERWSILLGGVLTPAAGVGAGVSFTIVRGFAVNAGEFVIWVPSAVDGGAPGAAAPTGANQLPHRYSYGTFIGANYVFGGR